MDAAAKVRRTVTLVELAAKLMFCDEAPLLVTLVIACGPMKSTCVTVNVSHVGAKLTGLAPGTVDAINVGAAVMSQQKLEALSELLRPGGLLLAPVCKPDAKISEGRCDGLLEVFEKDDAGIPQLFGVR